MSKTTISLTSSVEQFFDESVREAAKIRGIELSFGTKQYVVALLSDFVKPRVTQQETTSLSVDSDHRDKPFTFLLDEAIHTQDVTQRFKKLCSLGDQILYTTGFFASHFEAKGVDEGYLISIGQTAYAGASHLLVRGGQTQDIDVYAPKQFNIFEELAHQFKSLVSLLSCLATSLSIHQAPEMEKWVLLYEKWVRTGDQFLGSALFSDAAFNHSSISKKGSIS